jgi:hypothetical protein
MKEKTLFTPKIRHFRTIFDNFISKLVSFWVEFKKFSKNYEKKTSIFRILLSGGEGATFPKR